MLDRDKLIALHLEALAELGWVPPAMEDVIDQILRGELLPLGLAGDVFECSDEKLRKLCELTVGTKPAGPTPKRIPRFCNAMLVSALRIHRPTRSCALTLGAI
ncbi:hypothetical protein ACVWXO_005911 [Bradyrhizobium sp. LM2.7]